MPLQQIKAEILEHWMATEPATAKAQPKEWLERQAKAQAQMALAEMAATRMPGMTDREAWSEVRGAMLCRCPTRRRTRGF